MNNTTTQQLKERIQSVQSETSTDQSHLLAALEQQPSNPKLLESLTHAFPERGPSVVHLYKQSLNNQKSLHKHLAWLPLLSDDVVDVDQWSPQCKAEVKERGRRLSDAGSVALVVMAGGSGTRLGFDHPKGLFVASPCLGQSLFELLAGRILSVQSVKSIQVCIMTSPETYSETLNFFTGHDYFGLNPNQVHLFMQTTIATLGTDGNVLLIEDESTVMESADGNGSVFASLKASGVLQILENRGIKAIQLVGIDNLLIPVMHPVLLGMMNSSECDMAALCVRKLTPAESVGVFARYSPSDLSGKSMESGCKRVLYDETIKSFTSTDGNYPPLGILEYSEQSDHLRNLKDSSGQLLFDVVNVNILAFSLRFVRMAALEPPQYHIAQKTVTIHTACVHCIKLESFFFDSLSILTRLSSQANFQLACVERDLIFAPIKNISGNDSPKTAQRLFRNRSNILLNKATAKATTASVKAILQKLKTFSEFECSPRIGTTANELLQIINQFLNQFQTELQVNGSTEATVVVLSGTREDPHLYFY